MTKLVKMGLGVSEIRIIKTSGRIFWVTLYKRVAHRLRKACLYTPATRVVSQPSSTASIDDKTGTNDSRHSSREVRQRAAENSIRFLTVRYSFHHTGLSVTVIIYIFISPSNGSKKRNK